MASISDKDIKDLDKNNRIYEFANSSGQLKFNFDLTTYNTKTRQHEKMKPFQVMALGLTEQCAKIGRGEVCDSVSIMSLADSQPDSIP